MSKRIIIVLVAFLGLGLLLFIIIVRQNNLKNNQGLLSRLSTSNNPTYPPSTLAQTTLWLEPKPITPDANGKVTISVYINANENQVTGVQLEIAYDPTLLQYESIKGSDLLGGKPVLIKKIDQGRGRITFGVGLGPDPQSAPIQGADEIATLVLRPVSKTVGSTEVKLLPESNITAIGVSGSALTDTKNTTVNLK
jgi:hypothetical protein